jgi:hypothetical protein
MPRRLAISDSERRVAVALAAVELAEQAELDVLGHVLRVLVAAQARDAAARRPSDKRSARLSDGR